MIGGSRAIPALYNIGNGVVIASLILQLLWFSFFVVVAFMFHRSMTLVPTAAARRPQIRWQSYLTTLYVVGFFVMVRSLFRAIEFIQGSNGSIQSKEILFYMFDPVLMFLAVVYLHWRHPSEVGLLLRGEEPCRNGLKLITMKPSQSMLKAGRR